jgi:hypothetical protein
MNKYRIEYCEENGIKVKEFNKYNVNNYTDFLEKKLEAINYTRCSTLLLCLDDDFNFLTKNKTYEMVSEPDGHYVVIDDFGEERLLWKKYFKILN